MRRASSAAMSAVREVLTGAAIRAMAAIRDMGEVFLGQVHDPNGGAVTDTQGNADVWVKVVDSMNGHPIVGRLFIPANILFSLPTDQDTCMVLRGRDSDGPGVPYVLHGDGGTQSRVPSWAIQSTPKDGLYTPRALRLETTGTDVEIVAGATSITITKDGDVTIIPHSGNVVSIGDTTGNTQFVMNGQDLRTYLQSMEAQINQLVSDHNSHTHVENGTAGPYPLIGSTLVPTVASTVHVNDPPATSTVVKTR